MERAWDVLLDVEKVAPCMPGATLDSVDGDEIRGKVKVKVGPINMTYAGTARFVERDRENGVVRLEASGKETKGAGTASAVVRSVLEDRGDHTAVVVLTTLNVTGKPAQFGRGVMNEVSGKLLGIFAANLAAMLAQADEPPAPATLAAPVAQDAKPAGADASEAALDELHLSARAVASLHKEDITTVGQLASKTDDELLAIDGIGKASVDEIRAKLAEHGKQPAAMAPAGAAPAAATPAASAAPAPASAASNGAAGSSKAAANGSRTGATATAGPRSTDTAPVHQEEALNLIRVAGMPVLKRSLPVLAGVTAVLIISLRRRLRRRHH